MERSWRLNYLSTFLILLGLLNFVFVGWVSFNRRNPCFPFKQSDAWLKLQYVKGFPSEALQSVLTSRPENLNIIHSEQRKSTEPEIYRASVEFIPSKPVILSTKFKEGNWKDFNWRNFYDRNNCTDIVPYELKRLKLYFFYGQGKRTVGGKNASEDAELVIDPETNRHCLYYQYQSK